MVAENCPKCGRLAYMSGGVCEFCGYDEIRYERASLPSPSFPPEHIPESIKVRELVGVMKRALRGETYESTVLLRGLDNPAWYSSEIVLRTPGHLLITPVRIGDKWTSLQKEER